MANNKQFSIWHFSMKFSEGLCYKRASTVLFKIGPVFPQNVSEALSVEDRARNSASLQAAKLSSSACVSGFFLCVSLSGIICVELSKIYSNVYLGFLIWPKRLIFLSIIPLLFWGLVFGFWFWFGFFSR